MPKAKSFSDQILTLAETLYADRFVGKYFLGLEDVDEGMWVATFDNPNEAVIKDAFGILSTFGTPTILAVPGDELFENVYSRQLIILLEEDPEVVDDSEDEEGNVEAFALTPQHLALGESFFSKEELIDLCRLAFESEMDFVRHALITEKRGTKPGWINKAAAKAGGNRNAARNRMIRALAAKGVLTNGKYKRKGDPAKVKKWEKFKKKGTAAALKAVKNANLNQKEKALAIRALKKATV